MATEIGCFSQMQSNVKWEISNFRNLPQANCECIKSPIFWVSDSKWQIWFYPKGDKDEHKDYISLHIQKLNGRKGFRASVAFSIYGENSLIKTYKFEKSFKQDNSGWGFPTFITLELLSELTMRDLNDTFTIECSVCDLENLLKQSTSTQTSKYDQGGQELAKNFEDILVSSTLSDVTIKIQQKEFHAHRAILTARSPVFASMFQHEMKEHLNGILDITDCDAESFQLFLLFIYTGKLDKTTNENSINLYQTAEKYCINDLKQMCCDLMLESLEIESVCDVIDLAMTYEETELLKKAYEFFNLNAVDIFQTEQWQNFVHQKPSVACSILKQMKRP